MVCILLENSNDPCAAQPWMLDVHVISTSWSQKPMVSPYQRGTSGPSRGTAPSMRNVRPIWMLVTKLSATPAVICTIFGVTMTVCGNWMANEYQRRMNPSGQQYCDGHCGAFVFA